MILLEDCDRVFASRKDASDLQKRLVTALLSLLDGVDALAGGGGEECYAVVGTCVDPLSLDPALRRPGRFDVEVEIGVPTSEDRASILEALCGELCPTVDTALLPALATAGHGMVGSDLEVALKVAVQRASAASSAAVPTAPAAGTHSMGTSSGGVSEDDALSSALGGLRIAGSNSGSCNGSATHLASFLTADLLLSALKSVTPSGLREVAIEVPTVRWTDIGGMEHVKQSLKEVAEWPLKHAALFKSMRIRPPRGVMLYGPPGCSKTLMAKALATESSMNFLAVRGPELMSKYLGESEKAIQTLFRRARAAAPSIIFFDEIDALAGIRGAGDSGVSDRVLSQLLTELDGSGVTDTGPAVIVVIATNRPDMLDPALTRPGRIDRKIYVGAPDSSSREQIFRLQLEGQPGTGCHTDP
jgi:AAA family ATPase